MPDEQGYADLVHWLLQAYDSRHIEVQHGASEEWAVEPEEKVSNVTGRWVETQAGVRTQSVRICAFETELDGEGDMREGWCGVEKCYVGCGDSLDSAARSVLAQMSEEVLAS